MNHIREIFYQSVFECFVLMQLKKEKNKRRNNNNVTKPTFPFSLKGEQKNGKRILYIYIYIYKILFPLPLWEGNKQYSITITCVFACVKSKN
ncbi:hypothetical protein JHK82_056741 [Glycine max]|nr:hypothetical protein JHK82_056741 [Glycine max]